MVEGAPSKTADFVRRPSTALRAVPLPTKTWGGFTHSQRGTTRSRNSIAALLHFFGLVIMQ